MGIGIVLLFGLVFVAGMISASIAGFIWSRRIKNRGRRASLIVLSSVVGLIGLVPIANVGYMLTRPPPNPIEALAEIFPTPLPSGIEPINAARANSSDYWSYYIEVKIGTREIEALRHARNLKPVVDPIDLSFRLNTDVEPPRFWPKSNCVGLAQYALKADMFAHLPPPRTWKEIRLFYCPADKTAFVWAVDVD